MSKQTIGSVNRTTLIVERPTGVDSEDVRCARCGIEIEPTDEWTERSYEVAGHKMLDSIHTWCAVMEGYKLRWPGPEGT